MNARWPWEALVSAAGGDERSAQRRLRLDHRQVSRYRSQGLTDARADELSCRLGLLPPSVWPDWSDVSAVECAADDCDARFVPIRRTHRFCSTRCKNRAVNARWKRDKYRSDPAWAAARRAERRAFYRECRDYELARQRAYDRRRREEAA